MNHLVLSERRGPITIVTLNRAEKRNALSRELIAELSTVIGGIASDRSTRCVILTHAGPTFCAGMDLAELRETVDATANSERIWDDAHRLSNLYEAIYTLPIPTIAAVHGAAVAGGAGLTTVCDLVVASPDAKFGYPEVRRGLVAAMVMPHLMRHVGERMARYLLLSGELISANQAFEAGLINEVVETSRLMDRAMELALACAEGGPEALKVTKELLREFSTQSVSIVETAQASAAPRLGDECRQGLGAFFDKKPVPWVNWK